MAYHLWKILLNASSVKIPHTNLLVFQCHSGHSEFITMADKIVRHKLDEKSLFSFELSLALERGVPLATSAVGSPPYNKLWWDLRSQTSAGFHPTNTIFCNLKLNPLSWEGEEDQDPENPKWSFQAPWGLPLYLPSSYCLWYLRYVLANDDLRIFLVWIIIDEGPPQCYQYTEMKVPS